MKIVKIVRMINKGHYGVVEVQLEDGSTGECYVGGEVESWFDHQHNKIKVFVKRKVDK